VPVTVTQVETYLGLVPGQDTAVVTQATDSANAYVARLPWLQAGDPPAVVETPDVVDGTIKLAARLYRRRNTPGGVEAFGDAGLAYVSRADPEVSTLLRLRTPRVG
jgi:hypothetical protein